MNDFREYIGVDYTPYLIHFGVGADDNPPGRGSGRYPKGSGDRPYQNDEDNPHARLKRAKSDIKTARTSMRRFRREMKTLENSGRLDRSEAARLRSVKEKYDQAYDDLNAAKKRAEQSKEDISEENANSAQKKREDRRHEAVKRGQVNLKDMTDEEIDYYTQRLQNEDRIKHLIGQKTASEIRAEADKRREDKWQDKRQAKKNETKLIGPKELVKRTLNAISTDVIVPYAKGFAVLKLEQHLFGEKNAADRFSKDGGVEETNKYSTRDVATMLAGVYNKNNLGKDNKNISNLNKQYNRSDDSDDNTTDNGKGKKSKNRDQDNSNKTQNQAQSQTQNQTKQEKAKSEKQSNDTDSDSGKKDKSWKSMFGDNSDRVDDYEQSFMYANPSKSKNGKFLDNLSKAKTYDADSSDYGVTMTNQVHNKVTKTLRKLSNTRMDPNDSTELENKASKIRVDNILKDFASGVLDYDRGRVESTYSGKNLDTPVFSSKDNHWNNNYEHDYAPTNESTSRSLLAQRVLSKASNSKLSLVEIADDLGVSASTVSDILKEKNKKR